MSASNQIVIDGLSELRSAIQELRSEITDIAVKVAHTEAHLHNVRLAVESYADLESRTRKLEEWTAGAKVRLALYGGGSGLGLAGLFELIRGAIGG